MLTTAWARDPLRVFDTGLGLTNMGVTEADVNRGRLNLPLAGLMLLDALETENEFKVIIEVSPAPLCPLPIALTCLS